MIQLLSIAFSIDEPGFNGMKIEVRYYDDESPRGEYGYEWDKYFALSFQDQHELTDEIAEQVGNRITEALCGDGYKSEE